MSERLRRERPERERVAAPRRHAPTRRRPSAAPSRRPGVASSRKPRAALPNSGVKLSKQRVAAPKKANGARRPVERPNGSKPPASPRVQRRRSIVVSLLLALSLLGFLFAFVYPTRTYLTQREQIQASRERLGILQRQTAALERDTKRLGGDAEVERIAREQYGLVRPGETPYVLVPATTPGTKPGAAPSTTPTTAPSGKSAAGK